MTRIPGHRLLHSPGPTHIPDEVLAAMHRQSMDLADPRLNHIIADCEAGLRYVLRTERAAIAMFASNAHGGWEACIENLVSPGGGVLVPITGHFAQQWALHARMLGREVVELPWREGYPIDPNALADALRADTGSRIEAVLVTHTDTSSSVTSDLAAIRAAMNSTGHPALMVVDVVASLAAAPFDFDALGVDAAVGGSQKGLMLPAGLAFVAFADRARERARSLPNARYYWNVERRQSDVSYLKFCGTPPEHMLMGMQAAMRLIREEGLDAILARHARLAGAVHAAIEGWREAGGVDFFAKDPGSRSVSVTTVAVAEGIDPEALRAVARERFQVAIAGGNGPLIGRVFRIGHLGDMNTAMILGCLAGVQAAMLVQSVPCAPDGIARAVAALAASDAG